MRIAFVGKGGSGKTTLAALFALYCKHAGNTVLTVDADINQHFAETLGLDHQPKNTLDVFENQLKKYLKGDNALIESELRFMKTTPPGTGSHLVRIHSKELQPMITDINGISHLATGALNEDDVGTRCFHGKTGLVEIVLNHLVDTKDEYVIVDMTAGADWFASGLFTKFDAVFLVVEATKKSTGIYQQFIEQLGEYKIPLYVVANKVEKEEDIAYIKGQIHSPLVATISSSDHVKNAERNDSLSILKLEKENIAGLSELKKIVDGSLRDWDKMYKQAVEFHLLNATTWMNKRFGHDFSKQVDPKWNHAVESKKMFS